MRDRSAVVLLVLVAAVAGCWTTPDRGVGNTAERVDRLEGQLRERQQASLQLQAEIDAMQAERQELRELLGETREAIQKLMGTGGIPAEQSFGFEVRDVSLGFLTCAIDTDGKKGDDAIAAYVSLQDQYGSSLKAAGHFRLDLFDLSRSKEQIIRSWTFTPQEAAGYWQRFPAGYQFKLPFGQPPQAKKVVLKVTFRQEGKEPLTATRELKVERP